MEIRDIVIGIGLNVNQTEFPEEIRETAGSLSLALGHPVNRAELTAAVWRHFEEVYKTYLEAQSLEPLRERYERGLVNRGRKVRVLDPAEPFEGTAMGITPFGVWGTFKLSAACRGGRCFRYRDKKQMGDWHERSVYKQ